MVTTSRQQVKPIYNWLFINTRHVDPLLRFEHSLVIAIGLKLGQLKTFIGCYKQAQNL